MQLLTALLDDKVILDGVTRRSTIQFARERSGKRLEVVEGKFAMSEVEDAAEEGKLLEAFTAGTAVYPASISEKQGL